MNVVLRYLHRVDFNVMPVSDLRKQFPKPVLNISTEDPLSVLRCPHQVVLGESRRYGWFVALAYEQPNDKPPLFQSEAAIEAPSDWRIPPRPPGRGINRALVIQDIRIFSDKHFKDDYPAGEDLSGLFEVVALNKADFGYRRFELTAFLEKEPNAVDELILILDAQPKTTSTFQFTIEYEQKGKGLEDFEFEADPVVLTSR